MTTRLLVSILAIWTLAICPVPAQSFDLFKEIDRVGKKVFDFKGHGKALEKGAKKVLDFKGHAKGLEKGAKDLFDFKGHAKDVQTAMNVFVDVLEDVFEEICRDIPDGSCAVCWTSEGGPYGEAYACEVGDPNYGVPPSQYSKSVLSKDEDQMEFEATLASFQPHFFEVEPWKDGLSPLVPLKKVSGIPLPTNVSLVSITESGRVRGQDTHGAGYFLSRRVKRNSSMYVTEFRYHGGIDFVAVPGETVFAPTDGTVARISNAYATNNQGLRAIVFETGELRFKVLYVSPRQRLKKGTWVKAGTAIGVAQDLSGKFGHEMTNHVHLTIIDGEGRRVAPSKKYRIND